MQEVRHGGERILCTEAERESTRGTVSPSPMQNRPIFTLLQRVLYATSAAYGREDTVQWSREGEIPHHRVAPPSQIEKYAGYSTLAQPASYARGCSHTRKENAHAHMAGPRQRDHSADPQ
jgi:hypothetical protein